MSITPQSRHLLISLLTVSMCWSTVADEMTITVNWPDALSMVAKQFGRLYGQGVSYEGPIYEHPDDLVDVQRNARPSLDAILNCGDRSTISPRFCYFIARYTVDPITREPTNILTALREVVDQYNQGGNPGRFATIETVAGPCIVPIAIKNISGTWTPVEPLLSRPIRLSVTNAPSMQALETILAALQSGANRRLIPPSFLPNTGSFTFSVDGAPARDALADLLSNPAYPGSNNSWCVRNFTCPPVIDVDVDMGVKGEPYPLTADHPRMLIGNVTHPDYRGEDAGGAATESRPPDLE